MCFKNGVYTGGNSLYERFTTPTTFRAENAYRAVLQNNSRAVSLFGARNMVFEGFEFRHTGPGAAALVIQVQMADLLTWSEDVVFRNNVMHDSWNNDILKINNGARRITVEGNVFYNQTGSDEHMDVNSVTDVVIQDNIFFNDFAGSGRPNANDTSSFIVMKDSNQGDDGQIGADRITVRRNVFLNWEGIGGSIFVLIGEDGKAIVFGGAPNLGFSIANGDSQFNPLSLVEGSWPGAGDVVVDASTADREDLKLGQTIGVQLDEQLAHADARSPATSPRACARRRGDRERVFTCPLRRRTGATPSSRRSAPGRRSAVP